MKSTVKSLFLGGSVFAVFVVCLYLFIAPIIVKGLVVLYPRKLTLSSAQQYYTVLSSLITFIVGTGGLALGYFYYMHKLKVDDETSDRERKRKRLDDLLSRLDSYDNLVDNLIYRRFSNERELRQLRARITRSFETVEIMLDLNDSLLGIDKDDMKRILRVNSFVDKNAILMHTDFRDLTDELLLSVKDTYINLLQAARRTCFKKVR